MNLNQKQIIHKIVKTIHTIELQWEHTLKRKALLDELALYLEHLDEYPDNELSWLHALGKKGFKSMNLEAFLSLMVPIERKYGINLKDSDFLVINQDGKKKETSKIPLYIVLDNIRSTFNVGSVFRTAECFGVQEILVAGYTPSPDQAKTKKTAMGTDKHTAWKHFNEAGKAVKYLKKKNIPLIAVETVAHAPSLYEYEFPKPCAIILGNEKFGLSRHLLNMADAVVQIPLYGWKNSLNIGVAFGICAYEIRRKWEKKERNKGRVTQRATGNHRGKKKI
ncbi:RNA methyltransferase [Spirochaetota bacterium]